MKQPSLLPNVWPKLPNTDDSSSGAEVHRLGGHGQHLVDGL